MLTYDMSSTPIGPMFSGEKLRQLREARGWNKAELAIAAKVSRPYIDNLELGLIKRPRDPYLEKLATALDVEVSALFSFPSQVEEQKPTESLEDISPTRTKMQLNLKTIEKLDEEGFAAIGGIIERMAKEAKDSYDARQRQRRQEKRARNKPDNPEQGGPVDK